MTYCLEGSCSIQLSYGTKNSDYSVGAFHHLKKRERMYGSYSYMGVGSYRPPSPTTRLVYRLVNFQQTTSLYLVTHILSAGYFPSEDELY